MLPIEASETAVGKLDDARRHCDANRVASLADILAIEATPLATRALPDNTYAALRAGAAIQPESPALSFFLAAAEFRQLHTLSYAALFAQITRAANMFRHLGIGRHDVVAFLLPNLPETHLTIWGGEAAGIVMAINPLLEATQIASLLEAARARILVTLGPASGADVWDKAVIATAKSSCLQRILSVDLSRYGQGAAIEPQASSTTRLRVDDFHAELAQHPAHALTFAEPEASDIASYFCTGGTTGQPKIARRTHGAEVFDAWAMGCVLRDTFAPSGTLFSGLPLFHVNAQLVTGLCAFTTGAHVILGTPQGYRGEDVLKRFWEIVEHHRINAFSGVPTIYSTLAQQPIGGHDISSLQMGICGAAPMPVELFRRFERATGVAILEGYGLTEGTCVSSINPPAGSKRIGSIGLRLPYQDMHVFVLDDTGAVAREAAEGEVGVLAIRGPNVFAGYVDPAHETSTWIDCDGVRWLNTGDLARQDREGYFWLTGRKKELIIRGGHNIDPKVIEEALAHHPAVALSAAIGRPDSRLGEVPVVYVQLRPGSIATEEELIGFAQTRIAERAAWPKVVRIVDALPTTAVGKLFKPELTQREIADVIHGECDAVGATISALEVVQDPARGMLARVTINGDATTLAERLGRYTFAVEIEPR